MKIEQRFTGMGQLGVLFIFLGPVVSGIAYAFWISAFRDRLISGLPIDPTPYLIFMFGGGIISLASFPMMIIGRSFEGFAIRKQEPDNGMWR